MTSRTCTACQGPLIKGVARIVCQRCGLTAALNTGRVDRTRQITVTLETWRSVAAARRLNVLDMIEAKE